jgi:serine acetyltransferase
MRIKIFLRIHYQIQWLRVNRLAWLSFPLIILHKILQVLIGLDFSYKVHIGPGLIIDHGQGLIVNKDVIIGRNVRLRNNVTIGVSSANYKGVPIIGDCVDIGVGVIILGDTRIAAKSTIGAGTLITKDVLEEGTYINRRLLEKL